jgi:CHAT domain-containing protein
MKSLFIGQINTYFLITAFSVLVLSQIEFSQNTATSQTADEETLRELTIRLYQDREKQDLEDYLSLWSPISTDAASKRENETEEFAAYERVKIEKFIIHSIRIQGETATVRISINLTGYNKKNGDFQHLIWCGPDVSECQLTHKLVKENGKWLILRQIESSKDLLSEFLELKTDAERETLLAENKDLVDRNFVNELSISALNLSSGKFDHQQALTLLRLALRLAEELKDKEIMAQTFSYLAPTYMRLGDHGLALMSDQRYLQLLIDLKDPGVANAWNSIGVDYDNLGDYERALNAYQKSLEARTPEVRAAGGGPYFLGNTGNVYLQIGDLLRARQSFENLIKAAETIKSEPESVRWKTIAMIGLGNISKAEGNYPGALEFYLKALKLNEESKVKGSDQFALKKISEIYLLLHQYPEALKYAEDAARIAEEIGIKDLGWEARVTAGRALIALKQPFQARAAFEDAIETIENMRGKYLGGEESQQLFFEDKSAPYQAMVELLVTQAKPDEAFAFAEKSKARVLLALLAGTRNTVTKSMTEAEKQEELRLTVKLAEANSLFERENQKPQPDQKRIAELREQLNQARLEHETFRSKLYLDHPELRVQRGEMKPITIEETVSLLPDQKSTIAEYVVTEDKTFLFVITRDDSAKASLKVFEINVKNKDLARQVESFRSKVAAGDLDFQKPARELYDLLLKPAQVQLSGKTNLIIVPDGSLWDLPFQSLRNETNQYLIEQTSISCAPSLTALREMSKKAKQRKPVLNLELLAFGNPVVSTETSNRIKQVLMSESLEPLPESERMVKELEKMYGANRSKVLVGNEAREETAKTESPKYRIVQFATHGILNNILPMYSHLVLSQDEKDRNEDGLLEAWEMKDLDLKAELVILSACETARGKVSGGEGVIGMSWAMFIAGAPTTVASQWKVESSSTTELMLEFHRQLLAGKNITKAEALRRASLKLLKTPKYNHPSYWAGFVMIGDGS